MPRGEHWQRVSRGSPCPICRRPDWCAVSANGTVVLCQRVESSRGIPWTALRELIEKSTTPAATTAVK
jgi:hypothetical protein